MLLRQSGGLDVFDPDESKQAFIDIENAYLNGPIYALSDVPKIKGVGLYGIHYLGDTLSYAKDYDCADPIYLGKVVPNGWHKAKIVDTSQSSNLHNRLMNHQTSINQVTNLQVADFMVRVLVLDPVWIESAESFLIRKFGPVWNLRIRGFGNKALGGGRGESQVSLWDQYHPGRERIRKLKHLLID